MSYEELVKKVENLHGRIIKLEPFHAAKDETHSAIAKRVAELEAKVKSLDRLEQLESEMSTVRKTIKAYLMQFERIDDYVNELRDAYNSVRDTSLAHGKWLSLNEERHEIIERHEKDHRNVMRSLKAMIDAHTTLINTLLLDSNRLHQAYYHIFPERREQDNRVDQQLDALMFKPSPDAEPDKA
jgi:predicted nuclease with TOPRIM domain